MPYVSMSRYRLLDNMLFLPAVMKTRGSLMIYLSVCLQLLARSEMSTTVSVKIV